MIEEYKNSHILGAIAGAGEMCIHQTEFRSSEAQVLAFLIKTEEALEIFGKVSGNYKVPIFLDEESFLSFINSKASHIDSFKEPKSYTNGYKDSWHNLVWPLDSRNDEPSLVLHDNSYWYKGGVLHRDNDLPAHININGLQQWYQNGLLHRISGGPTSITDTEHILIKRWHYKDKSHRDGDLPAYISYDQKTNKPHTQSWMKDGEHHRENGPALVCDGGTKVWFCHGKVTRAEGPRADRYLVEKTQ